MNQFSYFYTNQAEKFTFYRIPKTLFTDERFIKLSTEAKVLYGLMLDRMGLSRTNGLIDKMNRVYIYFTLDEVMEILRHIDNMGSAAYAADAERIRATMAESWDMVRGLFREALMLGSK